MTSTRAALPEVKSTVPHRRGWRTGTANSTVWHGFAGSVLLLLGSFGVGWLAGSSVLIRTPLFIAARTTLAASIITTVLLCVGAALLLRSWLRLRQHLDGWGPESAPVLKKALVLWLAPLMLALPLFSRDSYAYIGQGRLMQEGLNPYTDGISSLNNYFVLGPDTLWTEAPTPYGPVWLWLELLAVSIPAASPEISLIPFRLACLAGIILLAVYVPRLAARHGFNPHRTLWLTVLNPVVLINFIASVHNDSLMLGLVVAGLYFASTHRPVRAILLVTASIAIKPITLIALPFVGLLWAGSRAGWLRKFGIWTATLGIFLALMAAMGFLNGLGFGWIGALQTPGAVWIWYAPVGLLSNAVGWFVTALGGAGATVADVIQSMCQVASILLVVVLALLPVKSAAFSRNDGAASGPDEARAYSQAVLRRMAWSFAAIVLLSSVIQPWYMLWLLAFFGMTGIAEGRQVRAVYFLTAFFTLIALTDQLSVYPWIPMSIIRTVAIVAGLACVTYVMVGEKKTGSLLLPAWDRKARGRAKAGASAAPTATEAGAGATDA